MRQSKPDDVDEFAAGLWLTNTGEPLDLEPWQATAIERMLTTVQPRIEHGQRCTGRRRRQARAVALELLLGLDGPVVITAPTAEQARSTTDTIVEELQAAGRLLRLDVTPLLEHVSTATPSRPSTERES